MGSYAARLADWESAVDIGRRVAGPGVPVPGVERARLREDMAEIVPRAEGLIRGFTDMEVQGFRSRAWVMARSEWIRANLNGLQRLLEPLAERMLDGRPTRANYKRKALGAQAGVLIGYVARKVLGQYDVFLPPDDEGLLYFIGPNIVEVERRFSLPPKDFRLWIAIHEVTHRVQFGSATWLRGYLAGQVDEYLGSIQLDSGQMMEQLKRAAVGGTVRRRLARDGRRVPAALARAARDVHADAGVDVAARRSRVLRDERGRARSRERRRPHAPRALRPAQGIEPGADHAEGDRVRAEDPPVRHRRALRPHDRRSRRHVDVQPGVAEPRRSADARGDRRNRSSGSRGWAASRSHAPTAARRPGPRTGDGDGTRARDVPARPVGAGRGVRRSRLGVHVGVARAAPTPVQDQPRGLPLRSSSPEGLRGGRRVRGAPLGAPLPAVPSARGDVVAAQGRVGRGVGARATALRDRGGHARDRGSTGRRSGTRWTTRPRRS